MILLRLISLALPLLIVLLLIGPVVATVIQTLDAESGPPLTLPPRMWAHTALIALVAAATATALGGAMAMWTVHLRARWLRGVALAAGAFPLVMPMYLHGMAAWQMAVGLGMYAERPEEGPWSDLAVVGLVQGLRLSAFVHLLLVAGWRTLHGRWIEAGLLVAGRGWVARRLLLPMLVPFAALGALLVAVLSATDVSVPLLFQVRSVVAMRLWNAHYTGLDTAAAWRAMLAPTLLLLAMVLIALPLLWRRAAPLLTARSDPADIPRGAGASWRLGLFGLAAIALVNAPLLHLLRQITSGSQLIETFRANGSLILATSETALGAAAIALIGGGALALGMRRAWTPLLTLGLALIAVPGFLWAAAAVMWWNAEDLRGAMLDAGVVRWLALGGRFLAVPALVLAFTLARQSARQSEAADLASLSAWDRWRWVAWPPLRRAAWVAYALSVLAVVGDLDAAILMDLPGRTTLVVGVCNRLHISPRSPEVAMMTAVTLATALALLALPVAAGAAWRRVRRVP